MDEQNVFTLINQQDGNLAFKIFSFEDNSHFDHLQRNNIYTIIWIKEGNGFLKVDFSEYVFEKNTFFAFSPFQPFMFSTDKNIKGIAIQFHSDFYCIHRNPAETNCDTVLFNNIYQAPFFKVEMEMERKFDLLIEELKSEFTSDDNQWFGIKLSSNFANIQGFSEASIHFNQFMVKTIDGKYSKDHISILQFGFNISYRYGHTLCCLDLIS